MLLHISLPHSLTEGCSYDLGPISAALFLPPHPAVAALRLLVTPCTFHTYCGRSVPSSLTRFPQFTLSCYGGCSWFLAPAPFSSVHFVLIQRRMFLVPCPVSLSPPFLFSLCPCQFSRSSPVYGCAPALPSVGFFFCTDLPVHVSLFLLLLGSFSSAFCSSVLPCS